VLRKRPKCLCLYALENRPSDRTLLVCGDAKYKREIFVKFNEIVHVTFFSKFAARRGGSRTMATSSGHRRRRRHKRGTPHLPRQYNDVEQKKQPTIRSLPHPGQYIKRTWANIELLDAVVSNLWNRRNLVELPSRTKMADSSRTGKACPILSMASAISSSPSFSVGERSPAVPNLSQLLSNFPSYPQIRPTFNLTVASANDS